MGNGIEGIVRNVEEAVCLFRRPGMRLGLSLMRRWISAEAIRMGGNKTREGS